VHDPEQVPAHDLANVLIRVAQADQPPDQFGKRRDVLEPGRRHPGDAIIIRADTHVVWAGDLAMRSMWRRAASISTFGNWER
jgi:hypothetical protein